jgi:peroxiredoxin
MGSPRSAEKSKTPQATVQKHQTWVKHHTKRNAAITAIVVAALVIIIVVASLPRPTINVGQQAPDFSLADVNGGGTFHLNAAKGTPVFLEFMRTQCEFCQRQAPILQQIFPNYGNRIMFVSLTIDPTTDQPNTLMAFAQNNMMMGNRTMHWYWLRDDLGNPVQDKYGVNGITPTMFVIDTNGIVRAKLLGLTQTPQLENALQTVL